MSMVFDTTIHDRSGLILSSSPPPTDSDINQAELLGIAAAAEWTKSTRLNVKQVKFWQRLHKEMFGEVWEWAGKWRQNQPNLGVPPHDIQPQLKRLEDDLAFWLSDQCNMSALEILARFHHRVVFIHPFSNGNGRWGRLVTDALATREIGLNAIVWADDSGDLRDPESSERKKYIAAVQASDDGNFNPLMEYVIRLNPDVNEGPDRN
jgi:Fic-DOC domain mobile mystery protein B